jgi:chemotaxis protein CheD
MKPAKKTMASPLDKLMPPEHVGPRLHYDNRLNAIMVWVCQGEFYVSTNSREVLTTILGSCIAVCIRDPETGFGGMNHFLLPEDTKINPGLPGLQLRYGSFSIERLINVLVSYGARREKLEIKVFGGANVIRGTSNIGHRNADFVEQYFKREGLTIAAKHLRGHTPRRVRYFPSTGVVHMSECGSDTAAEFLRNESRLPLEAEVVRKAGEVEIFENPMPAAKHPAR